MSDVNRMQQQQLKADTAAAELIKEREKTHEAMEQRMSETLRFLTERDLQMRQHHISTQQYFPQYGTTTGIGTGFLSGAAAVAGGYGGIHIGRAMGFGKFGRILTPAMAAMAAYGAAGTVAGEYMGSEDSVSGMYNRDIMNRVLPMAAYHGRSNWQSEQGMIQAPEMFRTTVGAPADAVAATFGLNPSQFLPGAMDLMREGMVSPTSSESGRSMTTALKESAMIFKAIQAFFGSVDIAGLTQQIKQLQAAGFTPEGMTDIGRAMQRSTLAFAPENIKQMVYQAVVQAGAGLSSRGVSAHLGGEAAISGMEAGYRGFGRLSDYDRTIFRTQEQYGQAITANFTSGMDNPFLTLGSGDAMAGLMSASGRFDLSSSSGIRDFRRTMYEVTSQMGATDFIKARDNQVRQAMDVFGLDQESAASSVFGSPEAGRAYMLEKEQRGDLMSSNIRALTSGKTGLNYMNEADMLTTLRDASSTGDTGAKLSALRRLRGRGGQASMLRHMINARTMRGRGSDADDIMSDGLAYSGGYINKRGLNRLWADTYESGYDWVDTEIMSLMDPDAGGSAVGRLRSLAGGAEGIASELSGLMSGYGEGAGDRIDEDVERALARYRRGGASVLIRERLDEERTSTNRGARDLSTVSDIMRQAGMDDVARIFADSRKAGQFLRRLEKEDGRGAAAITRYITGSKSLDPMQSALSMLNGDVVTARNDSVLGTAGRMLQNPLGMAIGTGIATVAGGVLGAAGGPLGIAKGMASGIMWGGMATSLLGQGLEALGSFSEGTVSKKLAGQVNASAYGAQTVVMAITGSMPEGMFSGIKAASGFQTGSRTQAAQIVSRIMYGIIREEVSKNKSVNPDSLARMVYDSLIQDLSNLRNSNDYAETLLNHYTSNPGIVHKAVEVIHAYAVSVDSPESTEVIDQRVLESVEKAASSFASGSTQKQTITAYRAALTGNTAGLVQRAGTDAATVQRDQRLLSTVSDVLSKEITTADGRKLTNPESIRDLYNAITTSVGSLSDADQKDPAKLEQVMKQAIEGKGFKANRSADQILSALQGQISARESTVKLSDSAKQILKDIFADPDLVTQIRNIVQPVQHI